ncbi:hypothetical protein RFI_34938 [Reticulomyxa filosa]|uniref:Uncharacterized protein n=1 Tax=Reticulomyxa filosa TaxID=46433 RepID=X6LLK9_RETFI|nr:hypothetical protein RFI_34938 [Reticulomyxa filosa]|eukprot:ETO02494.1 hypothetical protein RFI_34938 [Reticulomyxa filosa]
MLGLHWLYSFFFSSCYIFAEEYIGKGALHVVYVWLVRLFEDRRAKTTFVITKNEIIYKNCNNYFFQVFCQNIQKNYKFKSFLINIYELCVYVLLKKKVFFFSLVVSSSTSPNSGDICTLQTTLVCCVYIYIFFDIINFVFLNNSLNPSKKKKTLGLKPIRIPKKIKEFVIFFIYMLFFFKMLKKICHCNWCFSSIAKVCFFGFFFKNEKIIQFVNFFLFVFYFCLRLYGYGKKGGNVEREKIEGKLCLRKMKKKKNDKIEKKRSKKCKKRKRERKKNGKKIIRRKKKRVKMKKKNVEMRISALCKEKDVVLDKETTLSIFYLLSGQLGDRETFSVCWTSLVIDEWDPNEHKATDAGNW